ncbi:hypothetical protein [Nonomuraea sp. NPDC049141]|uniref:hypothetical protein n=1 Tax=Nonomuraea sp. NPDC049141 TaxID=3155500 RepID=UPI0033E80AE3
MVRPLVAIVQIQPLAVALPSASQVASARNAVVVPKGGVPVDQGVVEVEHQQWHARR